MRNGENMHYYYEQKEPCPKERARESGQASRSVHQRHALELISAKRDIIQRRHYSKHSPIHGDDERILVLHY